MTKSHYAGCFTTSGCGVDHLSKTRLDERLRVNSPTKTKKSLVSWGQFQYPDRIERGNVLTGAIFHGFAKLPQICACEALAGLVLWYA